MSQISGHNSRGESVFIVTTTTFVAASVFLAARIQSRFVVLKSRTLDDWCIIVAWLVAFGLSFSIDYGITKGLGRYDSDIPNDWLPALRRAEYAFTILYSPALMATKTSILIFYLRLSRNTQKFLRIASYVTLAVVDIAGVVLTFLNVFQCSPVSAAYDPTETNEKCMSIVTLFLCSAPVNISTDLAILVLLIPVLTGIRLPQRQKVILVGTFALGIFVTIVDVVRIYYLQQAVDYQVGAKNHLGTRLDFDWNTSTALMWSAVEVNVGIICACIPTLKPLIKRLMPSMIADHTGQSGASLKLSSGSSQARNDEPRSRQWSAADPLTGPGPQPLGPAHVHDIEREIDMMDFLTTPEGGGTMNRTHTQSSHTQPEREMDMVDFLDSSDGRGTTTRTHTNQEHDQEQDIDRLDFLTTPRRSPTIRRTRTARTAATANTAYFGFVNMKQPKCMLKTKGLESFKYCALVTTLFFLWGFSYGLLNTLNNEISKIAGQSLSQNLCLSSAYFGAYFFGALTIGQWVLRHAGFKATFITGLCIYGTGTLMFWPSAVLTSFPGFIISNFVVGFGLSVLETAANPFLALCGPSDRAEFRLLLAQGVQAVATVLSQLLAENVFFANVANKPSLIDVQWTYLAVALFVVFLALFFYYMPLPETSDAELAQQSQDLSIHPTDAISFLPLIPNFSFSHPSIYTTLALAIFAQFLYVAGQESMSTWFGTLLTSLESPPGGGELILTINNYTVLAHTLFAVGRFLFAPLCLYIPPRILLLFILSGCLVFSILTMALSVSGNSMAGPALVFFFFEGPVFPMVFALGLRGMGRWTKYAAGGLAASVSGGSVFPFVMFAIQRVDRRSVEYSYVVNVTLFSFALLFPIYLNFSGKAKGQVDPVKLRRNETLSRVGAGNGENGWEGRGGSFGGDGDGDGARGDSTPIRRLSRGMEAVWGKINLGGGARKYKGRRKSSRGEMGFMEYREMGSWASAGTEGGKS